MNWAVNLQYEILGKNGKNGISTEIKADSVGQALELACMKLKVKARGEALFIRGVHIQELKG